MSETSLIEKMKPYVHEIHDTWAKMDALINAEKKAEEKFSLDRIDEYLEESRLRVYISIEAFYYLDRIKRGDYWCSYSLDITTSARMELYGKPTIKELYEHGKDSKIRT